MNKSHHHLTVSSPGLTSFAVPNYFVIILIPRVIITIGSGVQHNIYHNLLQFIISVPYGVLAHCAKDNAKAVMDIRKLVSENIYSRSTLITLR